MLVIIRSVTKIRNHKERALVSLDSMNDETGDNLLAMSKNNNYLGEQGEELTVTYQLLIRFRTAFDDMTSITTKYPRITS